MSGAPPAEGVLKGAGDVPLHTLRWALPRPRGAVVLVHGFGEHAGRYGEIADLLAGRGWAVLAYDQRGHGCSGGRRGVLRGFELLLDDLALVLTEARALGAPGPPFLLGHSMGGLVALRLLQTRHPAVAGTVLSAPWLATAAAIPRWKSAAASVLRRIAPDLTLASGIDPAQLTRDPQAQRRYAEDPLVHGRVSSRWFDEMERAQERALDGPLPGPALVLVPGADPVADGATTLGWARRAARGDVSVETLEASRHEPFHEIGRQAVMERVAAWLEAHVPAGEGGPREEDVQEGRANPRRQGG